VLFRSDRKNFDIKLDANRELIKQLESELGELNIVTQEFSCHDKLLENQMVEFNTNCIKSCEDKKILVIDYFTKFKSYVQDKCGETISYSLSKVKYRLKLFFEVRNSTIHNIAFVSGYLEEGVE
jgi:hypothetical protein